MLTLLRVYWFNYPLIFSVCYLENGKSLSCSYYHVIDSSKGKKQRILLSNPYGRGFDAIEKVSKIDIFLGLIVRFGSF
jgi:hypothetical protein